MSTIDTRNLAADPALLTATSRWLESRRAEERVDWALEHLPPTPVLTSSFGAQAAVSLHLVAHRHPDVPVVVIDTGYLFPETYRFIDTLADRLGLDVRVYRSAISPAWLESRHGRLWEQGREGIERYNQLVKVEPLQRALADLGVGTWLAGLRRAQASTRRGIEVLERRDGRFKVHPIADWSDREIYRYLERHGLPYHPLWHEGYVSIGDRHSTSPFEPGMRLEDTRFGGLKRECGIHGLDG